MPHCDSDSHTDCNADSNRNCHCDGDAYGNINTKSEAHTDGTTSPNAGASSIAP
jgi:hypothetical protein